MANLIKIKRSATTVIPVSLAEGELAYSEKADTKLLYIGTNGGADIETIGGKAIVDKVNGIEAGADVTDATNVDAAGAVMNADYDAHTILAATTDDTPVALTVTEQTLVGRITAGNIAALTPTQIRTLINVEDGATADQTGAEIKSLYEGELDTNAFTDAEKSKLGGIEAGADVTDATNVAAAGAVMEGDTSTAAMSFVIDEDNMASNLDTKVPTQQSVKAYADTMLPLAGGTLTGNLTLNADPTNALHAATKQYVDARAAGLDVKESVDVSTTANVTLSGEQTIDGVLTSTSRILVKDQTAPAENGIYVTAAGAWSRATDADVSAEVTQGMFVFCSGGTANAGKGFVLTTLNPITLGTTGLTFTTMTATPIGAVLATDYNAQTVLAAVSDDTPTAVTVDEQRVVGRITGGNVGAITGDNVLAMMTVVSQANAENSAVTSSWAWTPQRVHQAVAAATLDGGSF